MCILIDLFIINRYKNFLHKLNLSRSTWTWIWMSTVLHYEVSLDSGDIMIMSPVLRLNHLDDGCHFRLRQLVTVFLLNISKHCVYGEIKWAHMFVKSIIHYFFHLLAKSGLKINVILHYPFGSFPHPQRDKNAF